MKKYTQTKVKTTSRRKGGEHT